MLLDENYEFGLLEETKYMFIATMGIKSEGTHFEQQMAILTFLGQADKHECADSQERIAFDLERYIQANLEPE